jgi:iron(III) transport system permease protein
MIHRGRDPWLGVALALGLVLIALVVLPQLWLVRASLVAPDGSPTLAHFARFFREARYLSALRNSVILSLVITALALVVAVPLAFVHARYRLPGKGAVLTLAAMATVTPPFLGAYVWIMLLGWSGLFSSALRAVGIPFDSIVGFQGIVWVGLWSTVGLVFLFAHDAFSNMDPSLEEAAMSVGASRRRAYLQVSLPMATPALLTVGYLVLMTAFTDFGTPKIIGGDVEVLPVLVYNEFLGEVSTSPSMASTASLVMVGLSTIVLMAQRWLLTRRSYALPGTARATRRPLSRLGTVLVMTWTGLVFLLVFTPHLVVTALSFVTWTMDVPRLPVTLANYEALGRRSLSPVLVSYVLALVSTVAAVVAGVLVAYIVVRRAFAVLGPGLNALVMFPYLVPGTVLAVGLIVAFSRPPLALTGTGAILGIAYFIRKLPYSMKAAEAALYQVHPSLEEAAMSVGATPARVFRDITVRLILPGLASGATLTFLATITELSATIMLYSAAWTTMTVVIFQAAQGMGGQFGVASATAVVMMVSIYVPLYLIRRHYRVGAVLS